MEFYSAGDYASAIAGLEEAANLDPSAPNISFFLGACYLLAGLPSEGITHLQQTAELGDTPFLEEALLLLAKAEINMGAFGPARDRLQAVLELDGEFVEDARTLLERLVRETGRLE